MKTNILKNNIPNDWKLARLGDVCHVVSGTKTPESTEDYLEIGDVDIINKTYDLSNKVKKTIKGAVNVPKGTLLISKVRPTRGAIVITKQKINISTAFSRLSIPNKFFYYVVNQKDFLRYLGSQAKGSTYPTCKDEDVLKYELVYPSSQIEQYKIGHILSVVDEEIAKIDEIILATEKLKLGLATQLFTKGIGNSNFSNTELGKLPSSWKVERLDKVSKIERGKFSHRPRNAPEFYGGNIPFIQTSDVVNSGGKICAYNQSLNEKGLSVSKLFPKGTIVLTIAANIGDTAILEFDSAFPDSLVGITVGDNMNNFFLEYYLRTRKDYLNSISTQSAQKNINLQKLNPMLVVRPPLEEQQKIVGILSAVDDKISLNKQLKSRFLVLKGGLMKDLLSGKVRTINN